MSQIVTAWQRLRAEIGDRKMQFRLCLRVTVAAIAAFVLAQFLTIPLAGLWAVLTAVVVTQMSLGGSLKAAVEYFVGTLSGAVYAAAIATLVPHNNEVSLLAVLALAVAPLALLAAVNPNFRVGPFTAVIVVLGATATHTDPLGSAFYRVIEVVLGGVTGVTVSLLVLPARAHVMMIEAASEMLDILARALPELFAGFTQTLDAEEVRRLQNSIGAVFARVDEIGAQAKQERTTYLAAERDSGPLLRTLLRLRHDFVMIGRAVAVPLPEQFQALLGPSLARVVETAAEYLRASGATLAAGRGPPPLDEFNAAMRAHAAVIAECRRDRLMRDLPSDTVERIFALGFTLEQFHQNFIDLARCVTEFAQSVIPSDAGLKKTPTQPPATR